MITASDRYNGPAEGASTFDPLAEIQSPADSSDEAELKNSEGLLFLRSGLTIQAKITNHARDLAELLAKFVFVPSAVPHARECLW